MVLTMVVALSKGVEDVSESPRNRDARSWSPYEENERDKSVNRDSTNPKNGMEDDNDDYEASF